MRSTILFLSCEHGGNEIPPAFQHLFAEHLATLESHQGFDHGALAVGEALKQACSCDFTFTTTSRLLIDCNRSLNNPKLFSDITKKLAKTDKNTIIESYYLPYRNQTEEFIKKYIDQGKQVLHVSVHSFTPVFNSIPRNAAIGLLYDTHRHGEKEVAREWSRLLSQHPPSYRIRMNYPYQGSSDGFTSYLRKKYSEDKYLGIELEINQSLLQDSHTTGQIKSMLTVSLNDLLLLL